jgi:hypothetical protein
MRYGSQKKYQLIEMRTEQIIGYSVIAKRHYIYEKMSKKRNGETRKKIKYNKALKF